MFQVELLYISDNIIKVWRLYPYAQESLAPLSSFYCAHTPVHMTVMRDKLFVAFQEHLTATYSVVMYNLQNNSKSFCSPFCAKLNITNHLMIFIKSPKGDKDNRIHLHCNIKYNLSNFPPCPVYIK